MITITPSPARKALVHRRGFTLVEVMIGATLGSFILLGVLTTYLFLGRSAANLRNYSDMEAQARKALELFAEDTRQASTVAWASADSVTMSFPTIAGSTPPLVTYAYASGNFTRQVSGGATSTLLTGITTFNFVVYTITGTAITDFSSSSARATANSTTKQIQISLSAARNSKTVTTATNIVLSARYVLRNKSVSA